MEKSSGSEIIVTVGLPASGKTTWARVLVETSPTTIVRVNRDDIRRMLGPYWVPKREKLVTAIERSMVYDAIQQGYSVVIDATNFCYTYFELYAQTQGVTFRVKDFTHVSLEVCIERDSKRQEPVGKEVIERMYNKYLKDKI